MTSEAPTSAAPLVWSVRTGRTIKTVTILNAQDTGEEELYRLAAEAAREAHPNLFGHTVKRVGNDALVLLYTD